MRIFTAVTFNNETKEFLCSLKSHIENSYSDARFTNIGNLHMTITFIGEVGKNTVNKVVKATAETAAESKGFYMELGDISSFRRRNKHTVYCKVRYSEELETLYELMRRKLENEGVEIDIKPFRPHITLARQAVKKRDFKDIHTPVHKCRVDDICVMESTRINGVLTYTPIARSKPEVLDEQNNS